MADQLGFVPSPGRLPAHAHVTVATGGQLDPELALNPQPKVDFGDGTDGDVVVDGAVVQLTRNMNYNNLTVINGSFLIPQGYKIKVKGLLTVDATSTIWVSAGTVTGGGDGAAGIGGIGDPILYFAAARLPETYRPTPGADGADGPAPASVDVSNGGAGGGGTASALIEGHVWAGAGGGGGGAVGTNPAPGGTATTVLHGAAGGAGGNAQHIAGNHQKAGGGGGAGGGMLEMWVNEIDNNGSIDARGTSGGDGEGDANAQAGGGGGGGGGAIIIYYRRVSGGGLGVRNVAGGAGGSSFGGVADGADGAVGYSVAIQIGV